MSALIRDSETRNAKPQPGPWLWPDRHEVTAPDVSAGRPVRGAPAPAAALWPSDLPERAWPPLPESERRKAEAARAPAAGPGEVLASMQWTQPVSAPAVALRGPMPQPAIPQPAVPLRDPSPSRLAYRLNRMWLTPAVRHFVRLGLPLMLVAGLAGSWVAQPENREAVRTWATGLVTHVQNQPMFQVTGLDVQSRSPEVVQGVTQVLDVSFPVSSWDLDLAALRHRVEQLDAVEAAWLQVRTGGTLEVRITERLPEMIWRTPEGLYLVDATGHRVARLATRSARADLPVIAGDGAPEAIAEARVLLAAAAPLRTRVRGLVRVGQRRWDLVLDRDQRILLPASGALEALERVVALTEGAQQLLSREVAIVDMRNPARPTLRMNADAMSYLLRNRNQARGAPRR